jgi:hypothetical protein
MKWVEAEGTHYLYFTRADGVSVPTVLGLNIALAPPSVETLLAASADFRLVVVRSFLEPEEGLVYYLHWDNGQDLDELDRKVERDTYTDGDFAHAAKTEYGPTTCQKCGQVWRTLVLPLGDPYIDAPGLYERKIREHAIIRTCPNCGEPLRQLVVKIF